MALLWVNNLKSAETRRIADSRVEDGSLPADTPSVVCDECGQPCDEGHGNRDRAVFCCWCVFHVAPPQVTIAFCDTCMDRPIPYELSADRNCQLCDAGIDLTVDRAFRVDADHYVCVACIEKTAEDDAARGDFNPHEQPYPSRG